MVAAAFKRFQASWLRFGGNKHILIKKINGKYTVKEAIQTCVDNGVPVLRLTGRMFEIGDGKTGIYNSPLFAGMMESFTEQDITIELCIAKAIGIWGCWPDNFIEIQDVKTAKSKVEQLTQVALPVNSLQTAQ